MAAHIFWVWLLLKLGRLVPFFFAIVPAVYSTMIPFLSLSSWGWLNVSASPVVARCHHCSVKIEEMRSPFHLKKYLNPDRLQTRHMFWRAHLITLDNSVVTYRPGTWHVIEGLWGCSSANLLHKRMKTTVTGPLSMYIVDQKLNTCFECRLKEYWKLS